MMIGMIDLEYAAGTLSVECTDEQYGLSTDCFQTDQKKMKLVCTNSFLNMLCTYTVRTKYEQSTNTVRSMYIQCMYKTWLKYIHCTSQYRIMNFVHTVYVLFICDIGKYERVCTDLYLHLQV
jgi:uncharacterized protein